MTSSVFPGQDGNPTRPSSSVNLEGLLVKTPEYQRVRHKGSFPSRPHVLLKHQWLIGLIPPVLTAWPPPPLVAPVPGLQCPILSDGPGRLSLSHSAPRAHEPCACKSRAGHICCAAHVAPRTLRNAAPVKIVKSYCPMEEREKGKKEKRHQQMLVPDKTWLILRCFSPLVCIQIMLSRDLSQLFSPGTISYRRAFQTSGSPFAVVTTINPN